MSTEALKFLTYDHKGPYSHAAWPLPKGKKPGDWVTTKGKLVVCNNGVHATRLETAIQWFQARVYLIELDGEIVTGNDKLCAARGRLIRELPWQPEVFAQDCADHVARYLAAKYAAKYAARSARYAARYAKYAARSARYAARYAKYAARSARSAARSARSAGDAARYAAESQWQVEQLAKHLGVEHLLTA